MITLVAGDSHTAALTSEGSVYAWGTYRKDGVWGFSPSAPVGEADIQRQPVLVYQASVGTTHNSSDDQIVKISSGTRLHHCKLRRVLSLGRTCDSTPQT